MKTPIPTVIRSIISPVVAVTFVAVGATGIMMLAHIRSGALKGLHEWAGLVMAIAALIHLIVNWRAFTSLFRHKKAIVAFALATALSVALFAAGAARKDQGRGRPGGPPCVDTGVQPGKAKPVGAAVR
ncbi:MAG: DUF4405 domain-containing protein [Bryobacteraceae bacterium]